MEKIKKFINKIINTLMILSALTTELLAIWLDEKFPSINVFLYANVVLFALIIIFGIINFRHYSKEDNNKRRKIVEYIISSITVGILALVSNYFNLYDYDLSKIKMYLLIAWAAITLFYLIWLVLNKIYYYFFFDDPQKITNSPASPSSSSSTSTPSSQNPISNNYTSHTNSQSRSATDRRHDLILKIGPVFLVFLVIAAFISLPFLFQGSSAAPWFANVNNLVSQILESENENDSSKQSEGKDKTESSDNKKTDSNASKKETDQTIKNPFLKYTCIFIIGLVILCIFFSTLYNIILNVVFKKKNTSMFLSDEYSGSIILLVTCLAVFYILITTSQTPNGSLALVQSATSSSISAIFMILLAMTLIEIAHLSLDQSTRNDSALRLCIRYVFLLFVKLFMDIFVGVLSSLHLKEILSSIFSTSIDIGKDDIIDSVIEKIEATIRKELSFISRKNNAQHISNDHKRYKIRRNIK